MPISRRELVVMLLAIVMSPRLGAAVGDAPPMLPGAWRQTTVIEVIDDETRVFTKLSERTETLCLTAAALAQPPLSSEKMERSGGKCEPIEREVMQDQASEVWRISCQAPNGKKYHMVSEVAYTQTTMRSVLHSVSEYLGEVIEGRVTTESERIGECTSGRE